MSEELKRLIADDAEAAWSRRVGSCNATRTSMQHEKDHFIAGWNRGQEALRAQDVARAPEGMAWRTGIPPTKDGDYDEYIVAVRRKAVPHRVCVFAANYANNYGKEELSDQDGNEYIADGWYTVGHDTSGEFDNLFMPMLEDGDEVLGWQPLPKWDSAPAAPAVAPAPTRDDWQKKALDYGFQYWRASDAHGVQATKEQAVDLLQSLLGVEVEISEPKKTDDELMAWANRVSCNKYSEEMDEIRKSLGLEEDCGYGEIIEAIEALREEAASAQAEQQGEPESSCDPADICAGCRCKYNTYGQAQQQGDKTCQHDWTLSITDGGGNSPWVCRKCGMREQPAANAEQQGAGEFVKLYRDGDVYQAYKSDTAGIAALQTEGWVLAEQPSARVALSEAQRTALYKQTAESMATLRTSFTYEVWCAEFVKRLLAASAAQTGESKC